MSNRDYGRSKQDSSKQSLFQPRIEAEEGEPTRFDFIVGALVVAFLVVAFLWAFGIVNLPGIPF